MDDKAKEEKSELRSKLEEAKREVSELGGWQGFKSGEWLFALIQKSFRSYYEHANAEYFQAKYASYDVEFIAGKLIALAARNAALLGALVGAAVALPAEKILVCSI